MVYWKLTFSQCSNPGFTYTVLGPVTLPCEDVDPTRGRNITVTTTKMVSKEQFPSMPLDETHVVVQSDWV